MWLLIHYGCMNGGHIAHQYYQASAGAGITFEAPLYCLPKD